MSLESLPLEIFVNATKLSSTATLMFHYGDYLRDNSPFWEKRAQILFQIPSLTYQKIHEIALNPTFGLSEKNFFPSEVQRYIFIITYLGYVEVKSEYLISINEALRRALLTQSNETIDYFLDRCTQMDVWILQAGAESPLKEIYMPRLVRKVIQLGTTSELLYVLGHLYYPDTDLQHMIVYNMGRDRHMEAQGLKPFPVEEPNPHIRRAVDFIGHQVSHPSYDDIRWFMKLIPLFEQDPWLNRHLLEYEPGNLSAALTTNDPTLIIKALHSDPITLPFYPIRGIDINLIQIIIDYFTEVNKDYEFLADIVLLSSLSDLRVFEYCMENIPVDFWDFLRRGDLTHVEMSDYARDIIHNLS